MQTAQHVLNAIGVSAGVLGLSVSIDTIQEIMSIVAIVISIISTIVSSLIIPLWKKIKDAKKDGKVSPEEAQEIANTIGKGLEDTKESIDKALQDAQKGSSDDDKKQP